MHHPKRGLIVHYESPKNIDVGLVLSFSMRFSILRNPHYLPHLGLDSPGGSTGHILFSKNSPIEN
jgi:hypothetical protein